MTIFDFQTQLSLGSEGEEAFLDRYPSPLSISLDKRWDFNRLSDGARVELKSDTYCPNKYPNFVMERFSDIERSTPGGPWRAKKDKIGLFIYYFAKTGLYYEFTNLAALVAELDSLIPSCREYKIKNKSWVTQAYAVPRNLLSHLCTEHWLDPKGIS